MHPEEGLIFALEPKGFVEKGLGRFLARLEKKPSKRPKRAALPAVKRLKACHGRTFPELERLDKVLGGAGFLETAGTTEWTPETWGPVLEPEKGANLAEVLIAAAQERWPPLLEELLSGAVALGWSKAGDLWLYGLYDSAGDPDAHAVHLWSHSSARIKATVAVDLDSFALAHVLLDLVSEGAIRSKVAARVAEQLAGRVAFTPPFDRVLEKLVHARRTFPTGLQTPEHTDRAAWIKAALLGEPASIIKREFVSEQNPPIDAKSWPRKLAAAANVPPLAAYLLFRSFLFGQSERLAAAVGALSSSPVPLVRDLAALMDELSRGRKELGQILDVQALQKEVMALKLDPDLEPAPEKRPKKAKAVGRPQARA